MLRFDTASVSIQGKRDYQEDAVICDFIEGSPTGFAVVADGMGGHAAGDRASQIAIDTAFQDLRCLRTSDASDEPPHRQLRSMLDRANGKIKDHSQNDPATVGMGTTFVATLINDDKLHWISVGDSPLYLYRSGVLQQINQDHSLAPQIDLLVASGLMSPEDGRNHPDRSVLTSVLVGDEIPKVDCPSDPIGLMSGDILIVASDGLQTLDHADIEATLKDCCNLPSSDIASRLLVELNAFADPEQDNASFVTIRVMPKADQSFAKKARRIHVREAPPKIAAFFRSHFHFSPKTKPSTR
ncbi:MAG: protein phosphatase 2C domain-containing protein [Pseudomonadota bacterium]